MQEPKQEPKVEKTAVEPEPAKEPTIEDAFPLEDFKDTIIVLFKHVIQGGPVSLKIIGNPWLAGEIMKGGRHEVSGTSGHTIVFNGNDVLWAECVTAREDRDRAIAQARAQLARAEKEAAEKAAKEKADENARVQEAKRLASVDKRIRWTGWLRGIPGGRRR